jgi:hypothetical protein
LELTGAEALARGETMHRSDGRQAESTDGEGGCSPHSRLQTSIHVEAREFVLTKLKSAVLPTW